MSLLVTLIGLGLLATGALVVRAGKQRTGDRTLVPIGRVALGVGTVAATIGVCWLVVAGV